YYIYLLKERKPPETAISDADRQRYREMLREFKQQQLLDAWLKNQQEQAKVSIHTSLQTT
ncbi:MAG: hypothetical protein IH612_04700, partial [Desulfofustis sp.]|nr:hypothetical protein [Desulfofustis sp.]